MNNSKRRRLAKQATKIKGLSGMEPSQKNLERMMSDFKNNVHNRKERRHAKPNA